MAGNNILTYVLLGGAAYLAYNWWQSQSAAVPAPISTGGGRVPPPTPVSVAPAAPVPTVPTTTPVSSTAQQLQAAAGASNLTADQWGYYWAQMGKTAIDPVTFGALFFPNGRPSDPSQNPTMTAAQFVAALGTKGLSGVRRYIAVPRMVAVNHGFGAHYTLADFRRAGRR